MNLNDIVDEIYVVNLDERTDRLESVKKQFDALNSTFTRFSAVKAIEGSQGNKHSWLKILQDAVEKGQKTIAVCEDDVVFRYQLLKDLPVLEPLIKSTDFDVLSMHHYCGMAGKASSLIRTPEVEEITLMRRPTKPWCNHFLILQNLKDWRDHLVTCIHNKKHCRRTLDNALTVFKRKCYVTSKEYAFQLDDFSDIQQKKIRRFKQKSRYGDIIT